MVTAKPECSIAELREVKRKADKEKIFRGIQPRSSDFRSQLNCNFKSYELYLFFLCTFPRGIEPLSLQCWAVPSVFSLYSRGDLSLNPTIPEEVHQCCVD